MAWYPKATKQEIAKWRTSMPSPKRLTLHVAVSSAESLFDFFSKAQVVSHFYVTRAGKVYQYVDTKYRAAADLEGNSSSISVETQGGVKNANAETWTQAQLESLAELYAWVRKTHGIHNKMATSSKEGRESWGLSWHRLGIDGNFPELPSVLAGRTQRGGGQKYSSSRGKICPGDAKIKQIEIIFKLSQETITPKPEPEKPTTPSKPTKPTKPATPNKPKPKPIAVDGFWGKETTKALQRLLKTPVDGVISSQVKNASNKNIVSMDFVSASKATGSTMAVALQKRLKVTPDGFIGPNTIKALQRHLRMSYVDGVVSYPSPMVRELQNRLNKGNLF